MWLIVKIRQQHNEKICNDNYYKFDKEVNMNKIFLVILALLLTVPVCQAQKRTIRTYNQIPNTDYSGYNTYSNDLIDVEEYLFGRNFRTDSLNYRLNRIENRLFNQNYSSMAPVDRVNNILLNYQDRYYNNYLSNSRNPDTLAQKILNRFIGQPTGFTPPIMNTPYNGYGYPVGINRYNTSNRGYNYSNTVPANVGAGIRILD